MKRILALDLATRCGWAAWHGDHMQSGVWQNPTRYCKSPGAFFAAFNGWLTDMKRWHSPEIVHWEMPRPVSISASLVAFGLVTRVQEWAYRHDIAPGSHVWPSQLKKLTTGDGSCGKDAMVQAMRARWRYAHLRDDNEADALAVLAWAMDQERTGRKEA